MLLQGILAAAWLDIEMAWKMQQINSEHCLQAVMHGALRKHLPDPGWQILVEPEMVPEGDGPKYPDLVIAREGIVRAVIELKFCPQGYVKYKEDIEKLLKFERSTNIDYPLNLNVCTGRYAEPLFKITEKTIFVFAVIAREDAEAVDLGVGSECQTPNLPARFGHLMGMITGRDGDPPRFTACFRKSEIARDSALAAG